MEIFSEIMDNSLSKGYFQQSIAYLSQLQEGGNRMPKLSVNLSMLFTEVDFSERFERAAKAGFKATEYLFPYSWEIDRLGEQLDRYDLQLSNLFRFIDEAGYTGWIGCEYKPSGKTEDSLGWTKPYL